MKTAGNLTRLKLSESANFSGITIKFKPPNQVLRSNADKQTRGKFAYRANKILCKKAMATLRAEVFSLTLREAGCRGEKEPLP